MEAWTQKDVDEYLHRKGFVQGVSADSTSGCGPEGRVRLPPAPHKLGRGKRVEIDGFKFQSQAEASRYLELKLLQQAGQISGLEPHPYWNIEIKGVHVCRVVADFLYWEKKVEPRLDGKGEHTLTSLVVEDVKKTRRDKNGKIMFTTNTNMSKLKQKLLLANYGIVVKIIEG